MRTRVKICGITRIKDAERAVALGVDAIGLVFYAKSNRAVSLPNAMQITRAIGPFVTTVGLFLDATQQYVKQVIDAVPLDLLQFHGDECPADCGVYGKPYIKAVPMGAETDVVLYARNYPDACGFLLDSHVPGGAGGLGTPFDWDKVPANLGRPLILAGGLNARNIAEAIGRIRPYAVDVSSGIEFDKGIKDEKKMAEFMKEVRRVDC
ncbi:MAG: phosphoribosylanthranilate isomerase [Pseudomonadota bacterium]